MVAHMCLLSNRNFALVRLLAQITKLNAHFPGYTINNVRLDNASEFLSQVFDNYWSVSTNVQHLVPYVHSQKCFSIINYKTFAINILLNDLHLYRDVLFCMLRDLYVLSQQLITSTQLYN